MQLPNGRRQILGFLLPGDLLTSTLFDQQLSYSVKALTPAQVSTMNRAEIHARLATNLDIIWAAANRCVAETRALEEMMAALGQLSAEERIAHLFLQLTKRIGEHNVVRENRYPLPLRQQDIADAVGLTSVHVSRVLGVFRERGIVDLSSGILEVLDLGELQRLGTLA